MKTKMSCHPLRMVYIHMFRRCYLPIDRAYKWYGARGISVCDEWRDPEVFYDWALPLWQPGLQIDRINNDGNYQPNNCRFVTPKENMNNRRGLLPEETKLLVVSDRAMGMNISAIARKHNISRPTVYEILAKSCQALRLQC
jgi:hypothetical protein